MIGSVMNKILKSVVLLAGVLLGGDAFALQKAAGRLNMGTFGFELPEGVYLLGNSGATDQNIIKNPEGKSVCAVYNLDGDNATLRFGWVDGTTCRSFSGDVPIDSTPGGIDPNAKAAWYVATTKPGIWVDVPYSAEFAKKLEDPIYRTIKIDVNSTDKKKQDSSPGVLSTMNGFIGQYYVGEKRFQHTGVGTSTWYTYDELNTNNLIQSTPKVYLPDNSPLALRRNPVGTMSKGDFGFALPDGMTLIGEKDALNDPRIIKNPEGKKVCAVYALGGNNAQLRFGWMSDDGALCNSTSGNSAIDGNIAWLVGTTKPGFWVDMQNNESFYTKLKEPIYRTIKPDPKGRDQSKQDSSPGILSTMNGLVGQYYVGEKRYWFTGFPFSTYDEIKSKIQPGKEPKIYILSGAAEPTIPEQDISGTLKMGGFGFSLPDGVFLIGNKPNALNDDRVIKNPEGKKVCAVYMNGKDNFSALRFGWVSDDGLVCKSVFGDVRIDAIQNVPTDPLAWLVGAKNPGSWVDVPNDNTFLEKLKDPAYRTIKMDSNAINKAKQDSSPGILSTMNGFIGQYYFNEKRFQYNGVGTTWYTYAELGSNNLIQAGKGPKIYVPANGAASNGGTGSGDIPLGGGLTGYSIAKAGTLFEGAGFLSAEKTPAALQRNNVYACAVPLKKDDISSYQVAIGYVDGNNCLFELWGDRSVAMGQGAYYINKAGTFKRTKTTPLFTLKSGISGYQTGVVKVGNGFGKTHDNANNNATTINAKKNSRLENGTVYGFSLDPADTTDDDSSGSNGAPPVTVLSKSAFSTTFTLASGVTLSETKGGNNIKDAASGRYACVYGIQSGNDAQAVMGYVQDGLCFGAGASGIQKVAIGQGASYVSVTGANWLRRVDVRAFDQTALFANNANATLSTGLGIKSGFYGKTLPKHPTENGKIAYANGETPTFDALGNDDMVYVLSSIQAASAQKIVSTLSKEGLNFSLSQGLSLVSDLNSPTALKSTSNKKVCVGYQKYSDFAKVLRFGFVTAGNTCAIAALNTQPKAFGSGDAYVLEMNGNWVDAKDQRAIDYMNRGQSLINDPASNGFLAEINGSSIGMYYPDTPTSTLVYARDDSGAGVMEAYANQAVKIFVPNS